MKTRRLRSCGAILLAVLALSCVHAYIHRDHLRFDHSPVGLSLGQDHEAERDVCLCFTHGLFIPAFVLPAEHGWSFELPLPLPTEDPLTLSAGEIFHPPLA
jgi:hypothetical protein